MARFEYEQTSPRGERRYELFENDGTEDGRLIASNLGQRDGERIAALLNATQPKGGGGSLAAFDRDELEHLTSNAGDELARRDPDRAEAGPPYTGSDTLDALAPDKPEDEACPLGCGWPRHQGPCAAQGPAGPLLPAEDADPWHGNNTPKVGVGATVGAGSDSYPYTIVKVSPSGHRIELRRDASRVVAGSFQGGDAACEYRADPNGAVEVATRRRNETDHGRPVYRLRGHDRRSGFVAVGRRRFYQDPHF